VAVPILERRDFRPSAVAWPRECLTLTKLRTLFASAPLAALYCPGEQADSVLCSLERRKGGEPASDGEAPVLVKVERGGRSRPPLEDLDVDNVLCNEVVDAAGDEAMDDGREPRA